MMMIYLMFRNVINGMHEVECCDDVRDLAAGGV